jgi:outer membrane protein OmpA-like peptidoglycan-associated protein
MRLASAAGVCVAVAAFSIAFPFPIGARTETAPQTASAPKPKPRPPAKPQAKPSSKPAAEPVVVPPGCASATASVFGTKEQTKVSLEGRIYFLKTGARALPDFDALKSEGSVWASEWNIPVRKFLNGFPGITDRFEWFALDYKGPIYVPVAGSYGFRLGSDDGGILYLDGKPVIDSDGIHGWRIKTGTVELTKGTHDFRLSFFQGPREYLGLQLWVTPPGGREKIFKLQDFNEDLLASRDRLAVDETATEIRVKFGAEVLFDTGKYDLKREATAALGQLADVLKGYPGYPIVIEGHTDSVGTPESNLVLSNNRAASVKTWLVEKGGVTEACISTKGYGQSRPIDTNATAAGRQKNRRVEVRLLKPGATPAK